MDQMFYRELGEILKPENIRLGEPMEGHTSFRVGGPADYFLTPETKEELAAVTGCCGRHGIPYYIMGNGSNLLVSDQGYRGVIIQIFRKMSGIRAEGKRICAQAGALLSAIAAQAQKSGLAGLEFASGIPGTVGGACVMNAGAYGGEMKQVLKRVTVMDRQGKIFEIPAERMELGYRTSVIAKRDYIVLEAELELSEGDPEEIRGRMEELREKRAEKQPLEYPSAGSAFKRPEGYFAGKLIDDSGLRGFSVGGAQVSEKHCGFIVNKGHATAADVAELMRRVQEKVFENFGVALEPEVKRLGEF